VLSGGTAFSSCPATADIPSLAGDTVSTPQRRPGLVGQSGAAAV
jgi:hypothetical protein